jgi:hypothetical protein
MKRLFAKGQTFKNATSEMPLRLYLCRSAGENHTAKPLL